MERSYNIPPPLLLEDDERHPKFNKKFKDIDCELPVGESLKNVIERLSPFLDEYMNYIKNNPGDHLVVAHSNSLRAIIKYLIIYLKKKLYLLIFQQACP